MVVIHLKAVFQPPLRTDADGDTVTEDKEERTKHYGLPRLDSGTVGPAPFFQISSVGKFERVSGGSAEDSVLALFDSVR